MTALRRKKVFRQMQHLRSGGKSSENALKYVPPQDVYTVDEVARLLHVSPDRLRSFAKRDNRPFPIRRFCNGARGSFILRCELIDWLVKNTISAEDEARERRRAKYDKE